MIHRATRLNLPAAPGAAILLLTVLVAACGSLSGDLGSVATPQITAAPSLDAPSSEPIPGETPDGSPGRRTPQPTEATTTILRVYFFLGSFTGNPGLAPVLRELPRTQAVGAAAMQALLDGPNAEELGARPAMYTAIPEGTRFLGLRIEDRIATVNLSREFESGGGSAAVLGRLAQVVYTLTQFPTVDRVRFELDGQPVTVFSGQGVVLDAPVDRADYRDQLPPIFVDRPAWGGVLGNPAQMAGVANVFEATFHARVLDPAGRTLADRVVMATCGSGCWGTFEDTAQYTVATPGWGTLQVFTDSAQDGSVENLTAYRVWLTP